MSQNPLRSGGSRPGPYPPRGNGKLPPRPPSPPANSRSADLLPQRPRSRSPSGDRSGGGKRSAHRSSRRRNSNRERDTEQDDRGGDRWQPPRGDFTFRQEKPAGIAESYDSYRPRDEGRGNNRDGRRDAPRYPQPPGTSRQSHHGQRDRGGRGGRGRGAGGYGGRPPFRPFVAAERQLLNMSHSTGDERALFDAEGAVTYRPMDQLSDSDEAAMDISADEGALDEAGDEPSAKRPRTLEAHPSVNEGSSAPKWSNPDPYTTLPPLTAAVNKKKRVVQMIRKARVQTEDARGTVPSEATDFISLDFDSDDAADDDGETSIPPSRTPTGPRGLSSYPVHQPTAGHGLPAKPPGTTDKTYDMQQPTTTGNHDDHRDDQNFARMPPPPRQADASLGSRKRTHGDEIKFPAATQPKRPAKPNGDITDEWRCVPAEAPCPWMRTDHSGTPVPTVRLHKEICDFYDFVKPRDFEERIRNDVVNSLRDFVRQKYADADVLPFGSFPSGLYLPTADMDVVFVSQQFRNSGMPKYHNKKVLWQLSAHLRRSNMARDEKIEVVAKAKVPLVKYVDVRTRLRMDLSFENLTGVNAIKTFLAWKEQYPAMPCLVTLIKHFLSMRGLNEPVNGGIGGFSVICLVVSMMQMMPSVQGGNVETSHCLGDLLMHFFLLYGHQFDYKNVAISLNPPRYIAKRNVSAFTYKNPDRLSIIDPNNEENDVSGGSGKWPLIKQLLATAHDQLEARMTQLAQKRPEEGGLESVLEVILAGNYSSFQWQRAHLLSLSTMGPGDNISYSTPHSPPRENNRGGGRSGGRGGSGGGGRRSDSGGGRDDQPGERPSGGRNRLLRNALRHQRK